MENCEYIMIFGIIIFILYFSANKKNYDSSMYLDMKDQNIDMKDQNIDMKDQNIDMKDQNIDMKEQNIDIKEQNIDIKEQNIDMKDQNILSLLKSKITRQTLIKENGGSKDYNNFKVSPKLSNNTINYQSQYQTYALLPNKIK
jgi:uncharacterized protein (DUF3084 family)